MSFEIMTEAIVVMASSIGVYLHPSLWLLACFYYDNFVGSQYSLLN